MPSSTSRKHNNDTNVDQAGRTTDRFSTDNKPQFRAAAAIINESKVVLDERFASVLTDPKYQLEVRDKYGRKKKKKKSSKNGSQPTAQNELSAFYSVEEKEDRSSLKVKKRFQEDDKKDSATKKPNQHKKTDDAESDADMDPSSRIAYLTALSRGELDVSSSSSDEGEGEDDEEEEMPTDDDSDDENERNKNNNAMGQAGILDPSYHNRQQGEANVEDRNKLTFEPSRHLAVLNMDWSHIRAVDIFAIVASFTPPGAVEKVQVFPSDFGMKQMAKEEQFGPSNVWKKKKKSSSEMDGEEDSASVETEHSDSDVAAMDDQPEGEQDDEVDDDVSEEDHGDYPLDNFLPKEDHVESDFDPEKLREYEASRLKYYFAVVYFANEEHADAAYNEVDGMEFEHSSSSIDVRAIPPGELDTAIQNRRLRDQATSIPSNYVPPDFVVNALQQTNVKCTWESGDTDRDRLLTKYTSSGQDWKALAEADDLRAYLASDASSDDEEKEDNRENDSHGAVKTSGKKGKKASMMRKMLGLDGSDDDDDDGGTSHSSHDDDDENGETEKDTGKTMLTELPLQDSDSDGGGGGGGDEGAMEARFVPGAKDLAEKIRSKMQQKTSSELTPWEKYQQKRKEKRREKKQEAKEKREEINQIRRGQSRSPVDEEDEQWNNDPFLLEESTNRSKRSASDELTKPRKPIGREELELLVAGDDKDESARDYDMRGLQRMDKNKDKKLRGARKRKEAQIAASVAGMTDFQMNLKDDRFKALIDGQDDRFGIDRTDPNYKDTPAMRDVLSEQGRRRRKNKKRKPESLSSATKGKAESVPKDTLEGGDSENMSQGASALSALVTRLKAKVS